MLAPPWCERCGRPLERGASRCGDCPPVVSWARSAYLYEGPVRSSLHRLKFGGTRSIVEAVAPAMADVLQRAPPFAGSGARTDRAERAWSVTWVPLGRRRRRSRGFDQAEVLARAVAATSGMTVLRLLERAVETAPQARRSASERALALRGSFRVARCPPVNVVLVDDVLTSGATGAECARTLLGAGARRVGLLTAARSLGGGVPARCYNPPGLRPGSVVARETISR